MRKIRADTKVKVHFLLGQTGDDRLDEDYSGDVDQPVTLLLREGERVLVPPRAILYVREER